MFYSEFHVISQLVVGGGLPRAVLQRDPHQLPVRRPTTSLTPFPFHSWWSEEGCRVLHYNVTHTSCQCDHLTSFAVLVEHRDDPATAADSLVSRGSVENFKTSFVILFYLH